MKTERENPLESDELSCKYVNLDGRLRCEVKEDFFFILTFRQMHDSRVSLISQWLDFFEAFATPFCLFLTNLIPLDGNAIFFVTHHRSVSIDPDNPHTPSDRQRDNLERILPSDIHPDPTDDFYPWHLSVMSKLVFVSSAVNSAFAKILLRDLIHPPGT